MPIDLEQLRGPLARILLAVLALLLIWLLRRLLIYLLSKPLRQLLARTGRNDIDDIIYGILLPPVRIVIFSLILFVVPRLLELPPALLSIADAIANTLIVVAVTLTIYKVISLLVSSRGRLYAVTGIAVEEPLLPFVRTGLQIVILAIALVIIIQNWGYDVSGLIAGLGIGGLAISLAAQDTLSNLFGFTAIVGDRPFAVGEYIKTPDVEGLIERVGVRSTRIRQLDQAIVTVPNSKLASSPVLNWSRLSKRRIDLKVGVTYSTTADQMETLLERLREMLAQREDVERDSVVVYFIEFGDSSLQILVRCYVNYAAWGEFTQAKELILLQIMRVMEEVGVQIAFPSRTLYLENAPSLFSREQQGEIAVEVDQQDK